ncbi:MAG: alginate export family protein [Acidobacteriota bacterium]
MGTRVTAALLAAALAGMTAPVAAQGTAPPTWRWSVANVTRVESWRFFEPPPSGGDPTYAFAANRLRVGLAGTWPRVDLQAVGQYVQFGGLPARAAGPGALGTGALYFSHSGETASRGIYLRALNVRARLPRGVSLQAGRFGYASGNEAGSGVPRIDGLKRARIDSRLIGEFEWSLYQRTFDGARLDVDRRRWHATSAWLRPTQGGFEEDAGSSLSEVDVFAGTLVLRPGAGLPRTDVSLFAYRYRDTRPVAARPDNTGRGAARVNVGVTTFGASAVGAAPAGAGDVDWLAWFAAQTGDWYGQDHGAYSLALEAGYQWKARWQPWVRVGYLDASGDDDPADDRHGTFFPMLPTVRKYAMTTAYATMNLRDLFAELSVRPSPRVTARGDARRLRLSSARDLWYGGSGATQRRGTFFGYAGRRSGGSADLGTAVQGALDVRLSPRWSANAFLGVIRAGRAVEATFAGRTLRFFYLESVVQW